MSFSVTLSHPLFVPLLGLFRARKNAPKLIFVGVTGRATRVDNALTEAETRNLKNHDPVF